jgi:hypothetical protein
MKRKRKLRNESNLNSEETLQHKFNKAAVSLSKEMGLDLHDLKEAYKKKPESLSLLNESFKATKSSRSENIFWTVAAVIFAWPIAFWPGYYWFKNNKKLEELKNSIGDEISENKRLAFYQNLNKNDKNTPQI